MILVDTSQIMMSIYKIENKTVYIHMIPKMTKKTFSFSPFFREITLLQNWFKQLFLNWKYLETCRPTNASLFRLGKAINLSTFMQVALIFRGFVASPWWARQRACGQYCVIRSQVLPPNTQSWCATLSYKVNKQSSHGHYLIFIILLLIILISIILMFIILIFIVLYRSKYSSQFLRIKTRFLVKCLQIR